MLLVLFSRNIRTFLLLLLLLPLTFPPVLVQQPLRDTAPTKGIAARRALGIHKGLGAEGAIHNVRHQGRVHVGILGGGVWWCCGCRRRSDDQGTRTTVHCEGRVLVLLDLAENNKYSDSATFG